MREKNSKFLFFAMILAITISCKKDSTPESDPDPAKRKITYLVMIVHDDNIVDDALFDIKSKASELDQVIAVVNHNDSIIKAQNIKGTLYYHYKGGEPKILKTADGFNKLGEDSKYLTEAINLAMKTAPADDYVLVFNGHGGGWDEGDVSEPLTRGILWPNSKENSLYHFGNGLSLNRLIQGYKNSDLAKINKKFRLVYFDNCLMHTAEWLTEIGQIGEYSIGSPTVTIAADHAYDNMIMNFRTKATYLEAITETAKHVHSIWVREDHYAIAQVVDLAVAATVPVKLGSLTNKLINLLNADPIKMKAAREVRSETFCYNFKYDEGGKENIIGVPLYDIGDFLYRMKSVVNDASYNALYNDFITTAVQSLIYSKPTLSKSPLNLGGQLADGNTNYLFSALITHIENGTSPYLEDKSNKSYSFLNMQIQGNWETLLKTLNTSDKRLPELW